MTDRRPPRVIAHRGASADRPDNTVAAFDEALRQGCDGIELDVQLSRDGVPVVWHDRTLWHAGGGRRRVAAVDSKELAALRIGGRPIPSLDAVLRRFGTRTRFLVEIKTRLGSGGRPGHRRLARAVVATLREHDMEHEAYLLCFDRGLLDSIARDAPRTSRVLNLRPPARPGRGLERRLSGLAAVSADIRTLTPEWVAAVRETGRPVFCYTCNRTRDVERACTAGVDGIMSDRPAWLRTTLATRASGR